MKRYVIFTAMVGNYDEILQPLIVDDRFDYILFTNDMHQSKIGAWQVRPIEYINKDRTRICRYIKTHPGLLLKEYEVSVWIDSNVQICSQYFYNRIVELDKQEVLISSMWHLDRDCIYDEAFAVVNMMIEHESVVIDWCHRLRKEKYPKHNGLCETGVMFRKHNACLTSEADAYWWQCIEKYSKRDQLSFNYVLWKLNIPCHYFFGKGKNVRNTEYLKLVMHKDVYRNHCQIDKNEAWLMRHCWKNPLDNNKISEWYFNLYSTRCPKLWIGMIGQCFRVRDWLARLLW